MSASPAFNMVHDTWVHSLSFLTPKELHILAAGSKRLARIALCSDVWEVHFRKDAPRSLIDCVDAAVEHLAQHGVPATAKEDPFPPTPPYFTLSLQREIARRFSNSEMLPWEWIYLETRDGHTHAVSATYGMLCDRLRLLEAPNIYQIPFMFKAKYVATAYINEAAQREAILTRMVPASSAEASAATARHRRSHSYDAVPSPTPRPTSSSSSVTPDTFFMPSRRAYGLFLTEWLPRFLSRMTQVAQLGTLALYDLVALVFAVLYLSAVAVHFAALAAPAFLAAWVPQLITNFDRWMFTPQFLPIPRGTVALLSTNLLFCAAALVSRVVCEIAYSPLPSSLILPNQHEWWVRALRFPLAAVRGCLGAYLQCEALPMVLKFTVGAALCMRDTPIATAIICTLLAEFFFSSWHGRPARRKIVRLVVDLAAVYGIVALCDRFSVGGMISSLGVGKWLEENVASLSLWIFSLSSLETAVPGFINDTERGDTSFLAGLVIGVPISVVYTALVTGGAFALASSELWTAPGTAPATPSGGAVATFSSRVQRIQAKVHRWHNSIIQSCAISTFFVVVEEALVSWCAGRIRIGHGSLWHAIIFRMGVSVFMETVQMIAGNAVRRCGMRLELPWANDHLTTCD